MKKISKKLLLLTIIFTIAAAMTACGAGDSKKSESSVAFSNEVDGKEYNVTYDKAPEKAVSVAGFSTEMMLELGLADSMAGYAYQDNPVIKELEPEIKKVKNLSDVNPSQEALLNAKPDFLVGWVSAFSEKNFSPKFCEDNGIKMYVPRVEYPNATMDTVYEDYENLGKIFRVEEKANKIVSKMKKDIKATEDKVKGKKKVKVFIFDSGEKEPFTASAGLPTDMIKRAGGKNVFAGTKENWIDVSWEKVIEANPEYIIVMKYDDSDDADGKVKFLKNNKALKDIDAIKNNKIFIMGLSDVLAGPRDPASIETMARHFHPEVFE